MPDIVWPLADTPVPLAASSGSSRSPCVVVGLRKTESPDIAPARVVVVADRERVEALVIHELVLGRRDAVGDRRPEVAGGLDDRRVRPAQRQPVLQQVVRLEARAAGLAAAVEALAHHRAVLVAHGPAQRVDARRVCRVEVAVRRMTVGLVGFGVLDDRRRQARVVARRRRRGEPVREARGWS